MNINLNYGLVFAENEKPVSNSEVTYNWITYAVSKKYPDGLKGQMLRVWGRLQRKFDDAVAHDQNENLPLKQHQIFYKNYDIFPHHFEIDFVKKIISSLQLVSLSVAICCFVVKSHERH